jgi:hypothetical protein
LQAVQSEADARVEEAQGMLVQVREVVQAQLVEAGAYTRSQFSST